MAENLPSEWLVENVCILCFQIVFYTVPKTDLDKISKSPDFRTDLTSKVSEDRPQVRL